MSHTVEVILTSFVVVWPSDPLAFSYQNHIKFVQVETVSSITVGEFSRGNLLGKIPQIL